MGNVVLYFSNSVDTAFCFSGLCDRVLMKYIYANIYVYFTLFAEEKFQKYTRKRIANLLRHVVKQTKNVKQNMILKSLR